MNHPDYEVFFHRDKYLKDVALHHHDFYEIYIFVEGLVTYIIESRRYTMAPGDILLISPTELHQPLIDDHPKIYKRIVIWISREHLLRLGGGDRTLFNCFDECAAQHSNLLRPQKRDAQRIFEMASALYTEYESADPYSGVAASSLLGGLMADINRLAAGGWLEAEQDGSSTLIREVLAFINGNLANNLTLGNIAGRFFTSIYHLSHRFKDEMGTSLHRYIVQRRLILAKQMLAEGGSPTAICKKCGFEEYSSFYRAFRSEYGISPRSFQQSLGI